MSDERRTHLAQVTVELEDVTDDDAREYWAALLDREVEAQPGGFVGVVVAVDLPDDVV